MVEGKEFYPKITPKYSVEGESVFEKPDPVTLSILGLIKGRVLEVGAGDGRYTLPMVSSGLTVVASDVDKEALTVLKEKTPQNHKQRVNTVIFDAFQTFPFPDQTFDGVVCTAFLYLFPEEYLKRFVSEANRVLKKKGRLAIDFLTDRKRLDKEGNEIVGEREVQYDFQTGNKLVRRVLKGSFKDVRQGVSEVDQDLRATAGYKLKGTKISFLAKKR